MNSDRYARISEAFLAVSDARPEDRSALLDRLCGEDVELRREVEALLACDGRSAALDTPALGLPVDRMVLDVLHQAAEIPHRIGQYEILGVLGQGGMGTVYRARQSRPDRVVALKVVNPALLTPAMLKRFEFEAQVLAQLQHPGIAQIFEAGTADVQGQRVPFFAMELVEGLPLTEYAVQRKLDVAQRLRLMMLTCDAVHHAHQKGIIHRDLKPANMLVVADATRHGGQAPRPATAAKLRDGATKGKQSVLSPQSSVLSAQPKILDFGVARATAGQQSMTLQTRPGQILGTLPYMSPEQLSGDPLAIDIRSDVYALGVIAHELLTGRPPYDVRGRSLAEAVRIIETAEPEPLSRHDRRLSGDVETIVSRAMHKDPSRRYASAADLAREIERYLAGEAIEARRDSSMYVLQKALSRHRVAVAVGCAFALVLTLATAASVTFLVREARQRRLAEQHAEETRQVAQFQSKMLQAIDVEAMGQGLASHFREQVKSGLEQRLVGEGSDARPRTPAEIESALAAFDQAAAVVRSADVARRVLDHYVLSPAGDLLETRFANQPLVRAQLHKTLGVTYRSLGLYDDAERYLRTALKLREGELGREHVEMAEVLTELAHVLQERGRYAAAEPLYREALALTEKHLGRANPQTMAALSDLASVLRNRGDYAAAEPMQREALALLRRFHGDRSPEVAVCMNNLAELLRAKGDPAGAESALREALAIHRAPLRVHNLAGVLAAAGRYDEAGPLQREALGLFRQELGDEHPLPITAMQGLANILSSRGELGEAESLLREAIALHRKLKSDDDGLARSLTGLGLLLQDRGDLDAAEPMLREALTLLRAQAGEGHPDVATVMNNLAALLHARRDYAAAEALYRQSLDIKRVVLGAEHPELAWILNNLAALMRDKGDFAAAEPLYRQAIPLFRKLGPDHPSLAAALAGLARVLFADNRFAEAEPLLREALAIQSARLTAGNPHTESTRAWLGRAVTKLGETAEAQELLLAACVALDRPGPEYASGRTVAIQGLIDLYEARHAAEPNGGFDAKAHEWRRKLADASPSAQRP